MCRITIQRSVRPPSAFRYGGCGGGVVGKKPCFRVLKQGLDNVTATTQCLEPCQQVVQQSHLDHPEEFLCHNDGDIIATDSHPLSEPQQVNYETLILSRVDDVIDSTVRSQVPNHFYQAEEAVGSESGDKQEGSRSTICAICSVETGSYNLNYGANTCK